MLTGKTLKLLTTKITRSLLKQKKGSKKRSYVMKDPKRGGKK